MNFLQNTLAILPICLLLASCKPANQQQEQTTEKPTIILEWDSIDCPYHVRMKYTKEVAEWKIFNKATNSMFINTDNQVLDFTFPPTGGRFHLIITDTDGDINNETAPFEIPSCEGHMIT